MFKHSSIIVILIILFSPVKAEATTFYGDTGLINTPSSKVMEDKKLNLSLAYMSSDSAYILNVPNSIYSVSIGFLPRSEIGIVFNQVFHGRQDRDNPYLKNSSFDRSIFLKFLALEETTYTPSVAVGGRDIFSNSLINFNQRFNSNTSYHQFFYLVLGKEIADFNFNLGFAYAPGIPIGFLGKDNLRENNSFRVNGIFASLQTPKLFSVVSGMLEYDSSNINYGLNIDPWNNISLKIAMINLVNPNIKLSWNNSL